jgi:hypothetical protein
MSFSEAPFADALWLFDASRQLLVYRDAASGDTAAFPERGILAAGFRMDGVRQALPRCSVSMGGPPGSPSPFRRPRFR